MKKKYKKITVFIILILICSLCVFLYTNNSSWYSEKQHTQRVENRIKRRFIDGDVLLNSVNSKTGLPSTANVKATDFEIYPLYNENDEPEYFLIEFEPYGYLYVYIRQKPIYSVFHGGYSMYAISSPHGNQPWCQRSFYEGSYSDATENGLEVCGGHDGKYVVYDKDEKGNKIMYLNSPFKVKGIKDEKRYLVGRSYLPAVKKGDKFVNLYSDEEFEIINGEYSEEQINADGGTSFGFYFFSLK